MDYALVGVVKPLGGRLDRIDVADQVGNGHVGRGQLLAVTPRTADPFDGRVVPVFGNEVPGAPADRRVGRTVDLAARDRGQVLVEQRDQGSQDTGLRLSPQSEENEVVPGQDRVDQFGDDGLLVTDDAGKDLFAAGKLDHQVVPHLVLDGPLRISHAAQRADGRGSGVVHVLSGVRKGIYSREDPWRGFPFRQSTNSIPRGLSCQPFFGFSRGSVRRLFL